MVAMRDRANEAEPEPVSRRAAAWLEPHKAVEDDLAIWFGNAWPAIGHLQRRTLFAAEHPDGQFTPVSILRRIVEEVGERLRQ